RHIEAEKLYRDVLRRRQKLADENQDQPSYRHRLATAHYNLGLLHWGINRNQEAEKLLRAALQILEELGDKHPTEAIYQDDAAAAWLTLGAVLQDVGRHVEAEKCYLRALACKEAIEKIDPEHAARPTHRGEMARTVHRLGAVRRESGKLDDAKKA